MHKHPRAVGSPGGLIGTLPVVIAVRALPGLAAEDHAALTGTAGPAVGPESQ